MTKRRSSNASLEREGVLAMAMACNGLHLIWRDLLQEDVGVDGTAELTLEGCPTGKLVGIQVKSGTSYIRSESKNSFKFYPSADGLDYWRKLIIPLFLIVYDPRSKDLFWLDVQRYMENRPEDILSDPYLLFSKTQKVGGTFQKYLEGRFDMVTYSNEDFARVRATLEQLVYEDDEIEGGSAQVTALDLFLSGLWGLCSKLQWHLTLLTEIIRAQLKERIEPSSVKYNLSREKLFPFLNGYFAVIGQEHLAQLDYDDLNYTLYSKLEWPTFIAPLTLNGRRFVEYLRGELAGDREVCDRQFFSLQLHPHMQIEVYSSFNAEAQQPYGPYTDVMIVKFNKYLDYYSVLHLSRKAEGNNPITKVAQVMFYYELRDYIEHVLGYIPKDNVLCRYQDMAISPLICWIERFLEMEVDFSAEDLAVEPPSQGADLSNELMSIFSPGSEVMTVTNHTIPDFRFLTLANGERIDN